MGLQRAIRMSNYVTQFILTYIWKYRLNKDISLWRWRVVLNCLPWAWKHESWGKKFSVLLWSPCGSPKILLKFGGQIQLQCRSSAETYSKEIRWTRSRVLSLSACVCGYDLETTGGLQMGLRCHCTGHPLSPSETGQLQKPGVEASFASSGSQSSCHMSLMLTHRSCSWRTVMLVGLRMYPFRRFQKFLTSMKMLLEAPSCFHFDGSEGIESKDPN